MPDDIVGFIYLAQKFLTGGVIIATAFFLSRFVRRNLSRTISGFEWSKQIGSLITTTVYYVILVIGFITGVSVMGFDITPIIAALGLGGFALGFALRDAVSNLLAGLLIIVYRPFSTGDYISVAGNEGKVMEINLRYTVLSGKDGRALIPNQMIMNTPVKIKKED